MLIGVNTTTFVRYSNFLALIIATEYTEDQEGYHCKRCPEKYIPITKLLDHLLNHLDGEDTSFIELRSQLDVSKVPLLSCFSCGIVFRSQMQYWLHIILHQKKQMNYSSSQDDVKNLLLNEDQVAEVDYSDVPPPYLLDLHEDDHLTYFDSPRYRKLCQLAMHGTLGELHHATHSTFNPFFFTCYLPPLEKRETDTLKTINLEKEGNDLIDSPPPSNRATTLMLLPNSSVFLSPYLPPTINCLSYDYQPNLSYGENLDYGIKSLSLSTKFTNYKIILYEICPINYEQVLSTHLNNDYLKNISIAIHSISSKSPTTILPILGIPNFMHVILAKPEEERIIDLDLLYSFYNRLKNFLMIKNIPFIDLSFFIPMPGERYIPNRLFSVLDSLPIFYKNGRLSLIARISATNYIEKSIEALNRLIHVYNNDFFLQHAFSNSA